MPSTPKALRRILFVDKLFISLSSHYGYHAVLGFAKLVRKPGVTITNVVRSFLSWRCAFCYVNP